MLPLVALFMSFAAFSDENLHDSHPSGRLKELNVHKSNFSGPIIPVLVLACNRITVSSCLDDLVRYRPNSHQFPIIVSQVRNTDFLKVCRNFNNYLYLSGQFEDCDHEPTRNVIQSYKEITYMRRPDQSCIFARWNGYHKIARHYKWALDETFDAGFEYLIIVEGYNEVFELILEAAISYSSFLRILTTLTNVEKNP